MFKNKQFKQFNLKKYRYLWTFLILIAFGLLSPLLAQDWAGVQLSGFEPFQQRAQNASWVLVEQVSQSYQGLKALQIPVVWDQPQQILERLQAQKQLPRVWIAFGEGSKGFQIELKADNLRRDSEDNLNQKPKQSQIKVNGKAEQRLAVKEETLKSVADALNQRGFPTKLSEEAGNYLCEEMLYQLLDFQRLQKEIGGKQLDNVFFVHVPILGATINLQGKEIQVNEAVLKAFGLALLDEFKKHGLI
jgi:pyroglutamyl-peptidase